MPDPCQRPVLIVVAGPNGAGKTSITRKLELLNHAWIRGCRRVNPDDMAQALGGFSLENFKQAANEAAQIREECLRRRKDLLFETVLSTPEKVDFIRRAGDAGYFVRVFFVGTKTPEINAARITRRFMENGHEVPISKIVARYSRSIINCVNVARLADRTYVYDNSIDHREARLIFKFKNGRLEKKYNPAPVWAREVAKALLPGA